MMISGLFRGDKKAKGESCLGMCCQDTDKRTCTNVGVIYTKSGGVCTATGFMLINNHAANYYI